MGLPMSRPEPSPGAAPPVDLWPRPLTVTRRPHTASTATPGSAACRAAAPDGTVTPGFWDRGACQLYFHEQVVASTTKLDFLASPASTR